MADLPVLLVPPLANSPATLLDVQQVASILNVSPRTVYRMSDAGTMPRPRHLGALVRWSRLEIEAWVKADCPSCHPVTKARAT